MPIEIKDGNNNNWSIPVYGISKMRIEKGWLYRYEYEVSFGELSTNIMYTICFVPA